MKRILPLCLALTLLLTGCVCMDASVEFKEDGSVTATVFQGMTVEAVNEAINAGTELGFEPTTQLVKNGITYLGEYTTESLGSYTELEEENLTVTRDGDSYTLTFKLTQEDIDESYSTFEGSAQSDIEAMLASAYIGYTFKMPYPVSQVGGPTDGVTVDGNTFALDLLKMKPGTLTFYSGKLSQFTDVAEGEWYTNAVNAMQAGGLVAGYGNGLFGPGDEITLASICTILARIDGKPVGPFNPGGYWAEHAVHYCINKGYINSCGEITGQNYNRPATREEVVAAISRAYAGLNVTGPYTSSYDSTIKTVSPEYAEAAMRKLYDATGYSVYVTSDTSRSIPEIAAEKFGQAVNGVVVQINYGKSGVPYNQSRKYYTDVGDSARSYIATLFSYDVDPFKSLTESDLPESHAKFGDTAYVVIPDVEEISPVYLDAVKTAYVTGLCSGVDAAGTFKPKSNITRAEVCQLFYNVNWTKPGVS